MPHPRPRSLAAHDEPLTFAVAASAGEPTSPPPAAAASIIGLISLGVTVGLVLAGTGHGLRTVVAPVAHVGGSAEVASRASTAGAGPALVRVAAKGADDDGSSGPC